MRVSSPPVAEPPAPAKVRTTRPSPRRLAIVVASALVVGLAAIGAAYLMDEPVDGAARDLAPIVVGRVFNPDEQPQTTAERPAPPQLTLILDRAAPNGISQLTPAQQVVRLRELVADGGNSDLYVHLGVAYMRLDDAAGAREAFTRAVALAPGDPAPRVGLAMTAGLEGDAGLRRGAREMQALAARYPRSQLVHFNRGWLAVYLDDVATLRAAWQETVRLGAGTRYGTTATQLLSEVGAAGG